MRRTVIIDQGKMCTLVALWAAAISLGTAATVGGADLNGNILSLEGTAVPGLELHLTGMGRFETTRPAHGRAQTRPVPGQEPSSAAVTARADGSFAVNGLREGIYLACATAPPPFLNPCEWGRPFGFEVRSGKVVGSANWRIESGATWEITIEDPGHALPSSDRIDAPALACGVISDSGAFVRSSLVRSDTRGRIYRVAVPIGKGFALSLSGRLVRFTDDAGKDLAFPHARIQLPARLKGETGHIVVRAVALTPAEKEQVKDR